MTPLAYTTDIYSVDLNLIKDNNINFSMDLRITLLTIIILLERSYRKNMNLYWASFDQMQDTIKTWIMYFPIQCLWYIILLTNPVASILNNYENCCLLLKIIDGTLFKFMNWIVGIFYSTELANSFLLYTQQKCNFFLARLILQ